MGMSKDHNVRLFLPGLFRQPVQIGNAVSVAVGHHDPVAAGRNGDQGRQVLPPPGVTVARDHIDRRISCQLPDLIRIRFYISGNDNPVQSFFFLQDLFQPLDSAMDV